MIVLFRKGRNFGKYEVTIRKKNKAPDQNQELHLKSFRIIANPSLTLCWYQRQYLPQVSRHIG